MAETTTPVRKRAIDFSAREVLAALAGATQFRRLVEPQPPYYCDTALFDHTGRGWFCEGLDDDGNCWDHFPADDVGLRCPFGRPGGRLWVRETWAEVGTMDPPHVTYKATYPACLPAGLENVPADIGAAGYRWRSPRHMLRRASRLLLEITEARVERVRDISDADARAEGAEDFYWGCYFDGFRSYTAVRANYRRAWDEANARRGYGWEANPWAWAVTYRRVEEER